MTLIPLGSGPLDVESMLDSHRGGGRTVSPDLLHQHLAAGRGSSPANPVPVVVMNPEALGGLRGGAAPAAAAARRSTIAVVRESLRDHGRVMEPREIGFLARLIPGYLIANGVLNELDRDAEAELRENIAELARQVRLQRNAEVAANNRRLEQLRRELEQRRRQLAQLQRR